MFSMAVAAMRRRRFAAAAALALSIRTLALQRGRREPNGEPTTADAGPRRATCSHDEYGRAARQAASGTVRRHFENAS